MSKEIRLYFFDPRPDEFQAGRQAALHEAFDNNEYWLVTDWGQENVKPHFYLTMNLEKPLDIDPHFTPAISYVVEKLAKYNLPLGVSKAVGAIILQMLPLQEQEKVLDVTITLPDNTVIRSSAGENSTIELDYDRVVRHGATPDQIAVLDKLQTLEYHADLRIKFASMNEKGRYTGDCREEYVSLFNDLPKGWHSNNQEFEIQTRAEGNRRAWALSYNEVNVGAVEHETGVEILIALGVGVAAPAIYDLIKWSLGKWVSRRQSISARGIPKAPTFLEVERTKRSADGTILSSEVLRLRCPVKDEELEQILDRFTSEAP